MKTKSLLTLTLLGLSGLAFGQKATQYTVDIRQDIQVNFDKVIDTVTAPLPISACIPNLAAGLITTPQGVQVSGTNSFGDKEKAQFYRYAGGGNITGALVIFGKKWMGTAAGTTNYNVKLYASTAAGPGTFLGTSQSVAYTAIDTTGGTTLFTFASSVAVIDSFLAAVVVDPGTAGPDSVAVVMLFDGSTITNDCGGNTSWERQSDNTWHLMNGTTPNDWGLDVQFLILPIISTGPVGVDEPSPLTTHRMYPNPSANVVNVAYTLNTLSDVKINIVDMAGKTVYTNLWSAQYSGAYNQIIDVTGYASGIYNYTIETGEYTVNGKLLVQ